MICVIERFPCKVVFRRDVQSEAIDFCELGFGNVICPVFCLISSGIADLRNVSASVHGVHYLTDHEVSKYHVCAC